MKGWGVIETRIGFGHNRKVKDVTGRVASLEVAAYEALA